MEIPTVYTIEETAELLKTNPQAILSEINSGRMQAFKVGDQWRTTSKDILDFMSRPETQDPVTQFTEQSSASTAMERTEAFSHTWPDGSVEEYAEAYEGVVTLDGRQVGAKIGIGERSAAGKVRKRVVVFLDGRPTVEFAGVDDFEKSRLVASVVTLRNRKRLRPGHRAPDEYRAFRLVRYNSVVTGPRAMSVVAVLASIDDLNTMLSHAAIRAAFREQK